jgi:integral membrane protein
MSLQSLRVVAIAEAVSYLCLLGAVVAKRVFDQPGGVSVIGPVHGVLFLAYFALVIFVREERGWSIRETLTALVAAVVPFGGYVVERRLLREMAIVR